MSYKGKERASEDEMEEGEQQDLRASSSRSRSKSYSPAEPDHGDAQEDEPEPEPQPQRMSKSVSRPCIRRLISHIAAIWVPKHVLDRPKPPTREEREAELALLEAQARAGQGTNDPRAKSRLKVGSFGLPSQNLR